MSRPSHGIMSVPENLQKAWDEANSLIGNGDPEKALDILREAWKDCKNNSQYAKTHRYAGDAETLWGEMDSNFQKKRWQKALKNYKAAEKLDSKDKEIRKSKNKLQSMMDENGISVNNGFQMFNDGNPTPSGLVSIVVVTMLVLVSFKVATDTLDPNGVGLWNVFNGDDTDDSVMDANSTVILEISYMDVNDERIDVEVEIKLRADYAPIHVENFLQLTKDYRYDSTEFHRIIDDFMIQGGDIDHQRGMGGYAGKWFGYCNGQITESYEDCELSDWTIPDETSEDNKGLLHESCTISMAKTSAVNTGGSQFFLIPEDSEPHHLDGVHTVFGQITSGCEHVTAISELPTTGDQNSDPVDPVILKRAYVKL